MVQPVSNVGIEWMVSDEMILEQSIDVNGLNPNVEDPRVCLHLGKFQATMVVKFQLYLEIE